MIFDLNLPWAEFRLKLQLFCAERHGIYKYAQLEMKIPWFKYGWFIYKYFKVFEIGKLPRQGCFRVLIFGKLIRDYYDNYPKLGEI